jgi:transcriptional regulator with XRE-family HTH domain
MAKRRVAMVHRRRELGLTQQTMAERLGISTTTYRDWERGVAMPRAGHRPALARRLEVSLVELGCMLDADDRVPAPHGVDVSAWLGTFAALEQGASEIRTFEPFVVPGLLQIPTYAAAIERRRPEPVSEATVAQKVQLRMARQDVLARFPEPIHLSVVIDESVLLRIAGDGEIMFDQLAHLVEQAARPRVDLRILPLDSGDFSAAFGSFTVLTSRESVEPYMACVTDAAGPHYLDRPHEVAVHYRLFEYLSNLSLSPEASVELMQTVSKERYT